MQKKFKDTKVGGFLTKFAPEVIDAVGDFFPPVKVVAGLFDAQPNVSTEQRAEFETLLKDYEANELAAYLADRRDARDLYKEKNNMADKVAKQVINLNLIVIAVLVVANIVCIMYLDKALLAIVSNVVGMVIQALIQERTTVVQFFFGSSKGSKDKDYNKIS